MGSIKRALRVITLPDIGTSMMNHPLQNGGNLKNPQSAPPNRVVRGGLGLGAPISQNTATSWILCTELIVVWVGVRGGVHFEPMSHFRLSDNNGIVNS